MKILKNEKLKLVLGLMLTVSASSALAGERIVVGTGTANDNSHSPDVAVDGQGRIHTVWMEEADDYFNVMYKLLDADGSVVVDKTQLSDSVADGDYSQGHPSLAVDSNGHAYVSWFSSDTEDGYLVGLNNGVEKFSPIMVADCKRSDLAIGSSGNVHMACSTGGGEVQMAVYGADGSTVTAPYVVQDSVQYGSYGISRVHLGLDSMNHGTIVYVQDYNDNLAYSYVDGVAGTTLTAHTVLTSTWGFHPSLSMSGDMAYVTFMNDEFDEGTAGDPELILASFTPSLNDIGYTESSAVAGLDPLAWYFNTRLGSDGEFIGSYNLGGGNGMAPRYEFTMSKSAVLTSGPTRLDADIDEHNYETYANYVAYSQAAEYMIYATDAADGEVNEIVLVSVAPSVPKGEGNGFLSLSLWSLLSVPAFIGLLRLSRRTKA